MCCLQFVSQNHVKLSRCVAKRQSSKPRESSRVIRSDRDRLQVPKLPQRQRKFLKFFIVPLPVCMYDKLPLPSFPLEFHILSSAFSPLPPSPPNVIPPPSPSLSLSLPCPLLSYRRHHCRVVQTFGRKVKVKKRFFFAEVTFFMSPNNSRKSHTHGPSHVGLYTLFAKRSRSKNEAEVTHPMSPNNSQKSHAHGPSHV